MTSELFAARLNKLLDKFNFPKSDEDREVTFCEYFDIARPKAKMILSGTVLPKKSIVDKIAEELFIDSEVLYS